MNGSKREKESNYSNITVSVMKLGEEGQIV